MSMKIDALVCFLLWVGIGLFGLVYSLQHARWRRIGRCPWGWYPSNALGNALQNLQALTQPSVEHVIEQMAEENCEEDDESGPDDPIEHLHRQARKIQRGSFAGPLKARVHR